MQSVLTRQIVKICIDLGILQPEDAERPWFILRTYAGRHQLAAGTWSWSLQCSDRGNLSGRIGSHTPASDLVKAKNPGYYYDHITKDFVLAED